MAATPTKMILPSMSLLFIRVMVSSTATEKHTNTRREMKYLFRQQFQKSPSHLSIHQRYYFVIRQVKYQYLEQKGFFDKKNLTIQQEVSLQSILCLDHL